MPYILYGNRCSGSTIVEIALALIGAPYEARDVDLQTDAQRSAPYAAVNPHRKLPSLLTPTGETLTESAAIAITLAERHPDAGLLPPPASPDRARALRWMLFVATELYPLVEILDYPARFAPEAASTEPLREVVRGHWRDRLQIVEAAIAGDPWLLPSGLSIADVYLAVVSRWAQLGDWRPDHVPRIEAIAAAIATHPRIGEVWRRHWPG